MNDWFDFDAEFTCTSCGNSNLFLPEGDKNSPVMIILDAPNNNAKQVLQSELRYNGINLQHLRIANLWVHDKNNDENCYKEGYNRCIEETKGKQLILLCGSDVVRAFAPNIGVKGWDGLEINTILSAPCVMVCSKPESVFYGYIGEFRLTLKKFSAKALKLL